MKRHVIHILKMIPQDQETEFPKQRIIHYKCPVPRCLKSSTSITRCYFTESRGFRFRGAQLARTDLRRRRYESADKASARHPGLRLSRQLGELRSDLSVTCRLLADGTQVRHF